MYWKQTDCEGWNVVLTVCDSAPQWPHWGISEKCSCYFFTAALQHTVSHCFIPAVNDNRSSVWNCTLCAVDFFQEPENATGVIGYPVVWPAQVLVMPDVPQWFLLQKDQRGIKRQWKDSFTLNLHAWRCVYIFVSNNICKVMTHCKVEKVEHFFKKFLPI